MKETEWNRSMKGGPTDHGADWGESSKGCVVAGDGAERVLGSTDRGGSGVDEEELGAQSVDDSGCRVGGGDHWRGPLG